MEQDLPWPRMDGDPSLLYAARAASVRRLIAVLVLALGGLAGSVSSLYQLETRFAYRAGETVREDVVAPKAVSVIDPERTRSLRIQEGLRIPPVFQYRADVADTVVANFRVTFAAARGNFLNEVEAAFNSRRLSAVLVDSPRFGDFHQAFQGTNELFPATVALAEIWAQGQPDDSIQEAIAAKLRAIMSRNICAEDIPSEAYGDSQQVRILTSTEKAGSLSDGPARLRAYYYRSALSTLTQAKAELQKRFSKDEHDVAQFCAELLKPNCLYDQQLTEQIRTSATEVIQAVDRYAAGQLIVGRGELITEKGKRALDQLTAQSVLERWSWRFSSLGFSLLVLWTVWRLISLPRFPKPLPPPSPEPVASPQALPSPDPPMQPAPTPTAALPGPLVATGSLPAPTITVIAGPPAASVSTTSSDGVAPVPPSSADAHYWQHRAREAEQHAEKAKAVVREGLIPHLARWTKDRLVQTLFSQRKRLLETQQATASEVAELEKRLADVTPQIEKQLGAYEKRIADLQKELMAKAEKRRSQGHSDGAN